MSVWIDRLKAELPISLSSRAKTIGAGKVKTMLQKPSSTVFLMIRNANGSPRNWAKYLKPTQSALQKPLTRLKRRKAKLTPQIGMKWNRIAQAMTTAIIR